MAFAILLFSATILPLGLFLINLIFFFLTLSALPFTLYAMLTIIHGDDIVASRKYFLDLKEKHKDAVSFDGGVVTMTDLTQIFEGGGLFEDSKTVFIEQLLAKKSRGGRKTKTSEPTELDAILAYFAKQASGNTIVLWENKEIERGSLLAFQSADIKVFKLPQTLFLLLDSIKPTNGPTLVKLFHRTIENAEPEMIFFMLLRQIRLLLGLYQSNAQDIDEIKRMQPWQKTKLQKQAAQFSLEQLKKIHHDLFQIEIGQKTGGLSTSVTSAIDFLLLEI